MIQIQDVSKRFGDIPAVVSVRADIREGQVFGLVGTNGAGKSTLLRMMAGVLKADSGTILVDGTSVYENAEAKSKICFIPDTGAFPASATPAVMMKYYSIFYPAFRTERCAQLLDRIGLDARRKIRTFSRGMKKQLSVVLGVCAGTKYLLCDETLDGLDPVMRQAVKSIFAMEMCDREFVPVIASHDMRELEDICDHVGLLHRGGLLFSEDLEEMKFHTQKVQCVLKDPEQETKLLGMLNVIRTEKRGSILSVVARGTRTEILETVTQFEPVFAESVPLTLEEIFISETEVAGYELSDIFA